MSANKKSEELDASPQLEFSFGFNVTDSQIDAWAKAAGMHIATNFDRSVMRRYAEIVVENMGKPKNDER